MARKRKKYLTKYIVSISLIAGLLVSIFTLQNSYKPAGKSFAQSGLSVNTNSVNVAINSGSSQKAFDIISTGSTQFSLPGYPTSYGAGINWSVSSGGISSGQSVSVNIEVNNGVNPGTYTGTAIVRDGNNNDITFPVSVTVVRTTTSRFVQVTYPNGGETLTKGSTISIHWNSYDVDSCTISYTTAPGSLDYIAQGVSASSGSYSWNVTIGNPTQAKIDMLCYKTGVGQVSDQSDGYFTVTSQGGVTAVTNTPTQTSSSGTGGTSNNSGTTTASTKTPTPKPKASLTKKPTQTPTVAITQEPQSGGLGEFITSPTDVPAELPTKVLSYKTIALIALLPLLGLGYYLFAYSKKK